MKQKHNKSEIKIFQLPVFILNFVGVVLNILLSAVVRATDLPFYIDTVGTITVTALGGLIPGIVTALVTNVFNFFMDGESVFYAALNMLIAVVTAAFFGRRKKEHPILENAGFILLTAAIGGGLGSLITWFLYATPSEAPMIVGIMNFLSRTFGIGVFGGHVISSLITDIMDKTISVLFAYLIIVTVPDKIKKMVKLSYWYQKPLSLEEQRVRQKEVKTSQSLGVRMSVIIILATVFTAAIISWLSLIDYRSTAYEWLSNSASQFATLAAKEIDPDMVDEFLQDGEAAPGYLETKERLIRIMDSSPDIAFLYVYKISDDGSHVIFDLDGFMGDGTPVPGDPPGTVVGYENDFFPYIDDMLDGLEIPSVLMADDYGHFITTACPVYDSDGKCVCYAISNVRVDQVESYTGTFLVRVLLLFSGFFILTVVLAVWITRYRMVMPIVSMTQYANEFVKSGAVDDESLKKIEKLDIRTGDEVELLYKAICKMTGDTVAQMNDIRAKSESIAKLQNGLIITMADMVESRDSDTGAHIQKTAAYVRIILQGLKKNGYYAEKINDKYMSDVEMSAPLHDVGKIKIPDAVLNKPGKLTNEEFEIMKSHTTEGKKFLENAKITVEGENYLKEARNMAAYHHERWDGQGYPEGLHGQVIPLSARIMAVADVFDALVSPRIYKPAFPLEEAVKILEEGSGKQFDPRVVEVFVEALPEVRKVMNKYKEA